MRLNEFGFFRAGGVLIGTLLDYFNMADPDAIKEAWADAMSRGPGWRKRAVEGRKALAAKAPKLVEALLE